MATIQAYIDDFARWARWLLRILGYLCGVLLFLPWLATANMGGQVAAIRGHPGGAVVIPDSHSWQHRLAAVAGLLTGAAATLGLGVVASLGLGTTAHWMRRCSVLGVAIASLVALGIAVIPRHEEVVLGCNTVPADALVPTLLAAWPHRRGNATRLLRQLTRLADQQAASVRLHARNMRVAHYYQRFGFVGPGRRGREMVRRPLGARPPRLR